jgi:hypothetical protein
MVLLRPLAVLVSFAILQVLAGCSGLRLYDNERKQQGDAARKAWSEVDLKAMIDGERGNLKKLLAAELDTQQKLATAIRDHELRSMVQRDVGTGLVEPVTRRLKDLAGAPELPTDAWRELQEAQRGVAEATQTFRRNGIALPACESIADGATPPSIQSWLDAQTNVGRKSSVKSALENLRTACGKKLLEEGVYASKEGAIHAAWDEYKREAAALAIRKNDLQGLQGAYGAARTEYDKAVAAATADPRSAANVKAAADKISDAIDALKRSPSPFAAKLLAEENIKSIDAFAQAITEAQPGKPLPKDASETAAIFIVIPGFFDEARTALAEAKKPLTLPLLIRRNYEQLNLEAAKRDIASSEAIVKLSHELVEALYQEAQQLALARSALMQPNVVPLHAKPFADAFKNSGPSEREALYGAAARYLDVLNRHEAKRYQLEYLRIAAYHERSLAYAEVNVKQWESLIGTSVSQVADYSASGFKPEQLANFLNTLGIMYIGVGVNK